MKKLLPHIYLRNCHEPLAFYHHVFGGEVKNTQTADDVEMFKGHDGKYIHAELHINEDCVIYFADVFEPIKQGNNIWLVVELESKQEIESVYEQLSENGEVKMDLQHTFWGATYGVVKDVYGITWELNYRK
ncbi:VOC family protein [Aquibacillus rhizosphaerae]|uniref:VOC family protein n=1 Tax=Aquibacillus rhizosphaerae TaxID=3051431 RepID=A0ABT7L5W1_9BACI|nr:VOC family protein [Aquibacillus sp. LR5S19]MDL4840592.1 VOC family protein [Aquibacillus sp. LR5S19]